MKGAIRNDLDWFLASICLRRVPALRNTKRSHGRSATWMNTYLIRDFYGPNRAGKGANNIAVRRIGASRAAQKPNRKTSARRSSR